MYYFRKSNQKVILKKVTTEQMLESNENVDDAVTWEKIRFKCTEGKCETTRKSLWLESNEEKENEKR